jgi:hypothetical protein
MSSNSVLAGAFDDFFGSHSLHGLIKRRKDRKAAKQTEDRDRDRDRGRGRGRERERMVNGGWLAR